MKPEILSDAGLDVALMTAQHVLAVFAHLLREEDLKDALGEIFIRVKAGMEMLSIQNRREILMPSPN